ncbi:MAG: sigma-70 family RNA polymerase sigma factor [Planctomycetota bacterium]|nr:sigma-70 family RNA polymerase sigma factor [Planctomycetota bacterium]
MESANRAVSKQELLRHMSWVRTLARGMLRDEHAAADVSQDAWVVAQAQAPGAGLRAWMAAVTRRLVRDSRRSHSRRERREQAASRPEAQPSAYEVVERSAMQQDVSKAVTDLDEPYRSTILFRYLDNLTTLEIAERMGTTAETVRQRLTRGRKILRARLDKKLGGAKLGGSWAGVVLGLSADELKRLATGGLLSGAKAKVALAATVVAVSAVGFRQLAPDPAGPLQAPPQLATAAALVRPIDQPIDQPIDVSPAEPLDDGDLLIPIAPGEEPSIDVPRFPSRTPRSPQFVMW